MYAWVVSLEHRRYSTEVITTQLADAWQPTGSRLAAQATTLLGVARLPLSRAAPKQYREIRRPPFALDASLRYVPTVGERVPQPF